MVDGNPLAMLLWLLSLLLPTLVLASPQVSSTLTTSTVTEEPTRPPKYPPILDCDSLVHPCYTYSNEVPCSKEWWRLLRLCEKDGCIKWKRYPGDVCNDKVIS